MTGQGSSAGRVLAGRYELTRQIGEGGMGLVYLARQAPLGREVVVKLVRRSDDEKRNLRFEKEAKLASHLSHPHIVAVHDFGEEDGELFLVMEHLSGTSLAERIKCARATWAWSLQRVRQIALALEAAHLKDVAHRDLKPANVFLVQQGGVTDFVKVLDFGLAKKIDPAPDDEAANLTHTGELLGTPGYISPEQIEGEPGDARSDLYALGVIWYEMLAGENPFKDTSHLKTLIRHLEERPRSLSDLGVALPADGERLLLRLLAKDPEVRPRDATELLERLRPLVGEAEHSVSSTRALEHHEAKAIAARRARRRTVVMAAAALGGLLTVALTTAALPRSPSGLGTEKRSDDESKLAEEPLQPIHAPAIDRPLAELGKVLYHRPFQALPVTDSKEQEKRRDAGLDPTPAVIRSTSCATCHPISGYGTTPEALTRMTFDSAPAPLNTPTTLNAYWNFKQKWDATEDTLVDIVGVPLGSARLMHTSWDLILSTLEHDRAVAARFRSLGLPIDKKSFSLAVAEYMKWTVPTGSAFDLWQDKGHDPGADLRRGYQRFKDLGCVACHQGRGVGGNMTSVLGLMRDAKALRGQCYTADDDGTRTYHSMCYSDEGCAHVGQGQCDFTRSEFPGDQPHYKVPSLRNVAMTAPYFHDGAAKTLPEAVRVMAALQLGIDLAPQDERDIVLFLESLTGKIDPAVLETP